MSQYVRIDFELNKSVKKKFLENLGDWMKIVVVGVSVLGSIFLLHRFMFCSRKKDDIAFKRKSLEKSELEKTTEGIVSVSKLIYQVDGYYDSQLEDVLPSSSKNSSDSSEESQESSSDHYNMHEYLDESSPIMPEAGKNN